MIAARLANRHGLFVDTRMTRVSGHAERLAALDMIASHADGPAAITLGGDKGYDAAKANFVMELREFNVTPHIARNTTRRSAIDGRTTRHPGYGASLRIRKRLEEGFGWMKTVAGFRKTTYRGIDKVGWAFTLAAAAYNLIRLPKLLAAT
jgi:IS5 family transposase